MSLPNWGLTIAYWLHMLATVGWVGSLAALAWVVLPAARHTLDTMAFANLLGAVQKRLEGLGWFSLALLAGTGMFQMSAHPNYQGFLVIDDAWGAAIFAKHLAFVVMIVSNAYTTWFLMPEMRRNALRRSRGQVVEPALEQRSLRLLNLSLGLAVIILALTAVARAA